MDKPDKKEETRLGRCSRGFLVFLCWILISGSAWLRAGTVEAAHPFLFIVGGLIGLALLFDVFRTRSFGLFFKDPIFYVGCSGLLLLIIQTINSGRVLYQKYSTGEWTYTDPPHPGWPFSFSQVESLEMIAWFLPALFLLLALRYLLRKGWLSRRFVLLLLCNAVLLAALGMAQYFTGTKEMFWRIPISAYFFSTFGYPNHAASYFALFFALSLGLLLSALFDFSKSERIRGALGSGQEGRSFLRLLFCLVVTGIMFVALMLTLSRAAMVLGAAALLLAGLYVFPLWFGLKLWGKLAALGLLVVAVVLAMHFGRPQLKGQLGREIEHLVHADLHKEVTTRTWQVQGATAIWREHPVCGVGGWGYKQLAAMYMPEDQWGLLGTGRANVHNDFFQFLCELGLWGLSVLLICVAVAAFSALKVARKQGVCRPQFFFSAVGLLLVVVHSLIDLPFRSPAVLYAWLAILVIGGGSVVRTSTAEQ